AYKHFCVVALGPDGKFLAVQPIWKFRDSSPNVAFPAERTIIVFDLDTTKERWRVQGKPVEYQAIAQLAFTPDGKRLAIVLDSRELKLWDTATGKAVAAA